MLRSQSPPLPWVPPEDEEVPVPRNLCFLLKPPLLSLTFLLGSFVLVTSLLPALVFGRSCTGSFSADLGVSTSSVRAGEARGRDGRGTGMGRDVSGLQQPAVSQLRNCSPDPLPQPLA